MTELHTNGGPKAVDRATNERLFDHPRITDDDVDAVRTALEDGDVSFAKRDGETRRLERRLREYFGGSRALCTNNGTSALYSALFAIGEGDRPERALEGAEVLCPTYEMWSAVAPILAFGGTPVFCEIDERTLTVDLDDAERKVTADTEALLFCEMWSEIGDPEAIRAFADDHDLAIVEDASHAWGCRYEGDPAGSIFDVGALSMQAGKSLPAGEGGVFVTDDERYFERAEALGHYARVDESGPFAEYDRTGLGYKFRMSPLCAALANSKFESLAERTQVEGDLMDGFREGVADVPYVGPIGAEVDGYEKRGHFGTCLRVDFDALTADKATVMDAFQAEGLRVRSEADVGFTLLHREERFRDGRPWGAGALPRSEAVYDELVRISAFRRGSSEDVARYVAGFEKVLAHFAP